MEPDKNAEYIDDIEYSAFLILELSERVQNLKITDIGISSMLLRAKDNLERKLQCQG